MNIFQLILLVGNSGGAEDEPEESLDFSLELNSQYISLF